MKYRVAAAAVLAAAALLFGCLSGCKGKAKPDPVEYADISSNGKIAVTAHHTSESIQIWNVETGKRIRTIKRLRGTPRWAFISPDGKTVASISSPVKHRIQFNRSWTRFVEFAAYLNQYDAIQLWDVATGELIQTLKEGGFDYVAAVFSPDGKKVASIGGLTGISGLKLWNAQTGEMIRRLSLTSFIYTLPAFSPDGRLLAGYDHVSEAIRLWNGQTGEKIAKINTKLPKGAVLFSPDGKTLAHVGNKAPIHLWNVETRAALHLMENPAAYALNNVAFSPDGTQLAAIALDGAMNKVSALVWDVETGKIVKTLPRSDRVMSIAFTEDGSEIVGMSRDLLIQRWNLKE